MRCEECEGHLFNCDTCNMPTCVECDGMLCRESSTSYCSGCLREEAAYWARYFGLAPKAANQARRDLDLSLHASDEEVMAAARLLK